MVQQYIWRNTSTIVMISLLRPFGQRGGTWLIDLPERLQVAKSLPQLRLAVSGWGVQYLSLQIYTLSWFPWVIAITGILISAVLFLSYWSLILAVRSAITNLVSISFVFGMLSMLYSETIGVSWLVPVVTFSILIGLNMDYDVFLLTGILEAKQIGLSTEAAIVRGMEVNSSVIGMAGIIMATAFCGLLFSSTVMNQQLALVMVVGVVFDTVFMQSMLVPAIMACLGDWNWWPTRFNAAEALAEAPGADAGHD
jgi:uncharacterized membrane protein YdfJ with MMPL/SSD domain